jgi:hypothetical protein
MLEKKYRAGTKKNPAAVENGPYTTSSLKGYYDVIVAFTVLHRFRLQKSRKKQVG